MSTTVTVQNVESSEGPKEVNEDNVIFWSQHAKMIQGDQQKKAHLLLVHDCVQYLGHDESSGKKTFIILPLNTEQFWHEIINGEDTVFIKKPFTHDYNKSAYRIYKNEEGMFECDCQGWNTKKVRGELNAEGVSCSHVLALFLAFKTGKFGKGDK